MEEHSSPAGAKVGMWLFLCTEILLFGGLFLLYSVYRYRNPQDFHAASQELDRVLGTLNTAVLITSSLSVALAGHALSRAAAPARRAAVGRLPGAWGPRFLVVKGFEWGAKFDHGLYPSSPVLLARAKGEILYFGLYFMMTGLHALHVLIGLGLLATVLVLVRRGRVSPGHPVLLENAGLYWHLVDMIWIFLFPLFYLIG